MWRIYYDDGSTHNHSQGFDKLEPYGVICILQQINHKNGTAYIINYGAPYYAYLDNEWIILQHNDVEDRLAHKLPIEHFLVGRAVSKSNFNKIYNKAQEDKAAENL